MNMSAAAKSLLLLLYCLLPSYALAQAEGEVESIGLGGYYRPNAWTPMKLRLRPTIGKPATYKLAIMQEDMDRDRVLYTRPFTLNGNPEGGRVEERVWVYFLPQPRDLQQVRNTQELSNLIKVFLCKEDGTQLVQIPIPPGTAPLTNLDEPAAFGSNRSTRFIITVGTSESRPFRDIYANARGITEEVIFQGVSPSDLPQNVLGYQAVDAIVWMDADPIEPESDTITAIQEYVTSGGKLVVTQNPDWQRMKESELAAMLPVELTGVRDEVGLLSLRSLAEIPLPGEEVSVNSPFSLPNGEVIDPWSDTADRIVPIATATPRAGARVNLMQATDPKAPYLARWMYGHGTVIWTAQDFGSTNVTSAGTYRKLGWENVWDKTFDWPNRTITEDMTLFARDPRYRAGAIKWSQDYNTLYKPAINNTDVSSSLLGAMELPRRGAALVALAVVFFIGYWLVAGPGSYFFLLAKKQSRYSWVAFAACALIATGLTIIVVRLVLRGPPQLQHVTFVRVSPGQDAIAHSQFGLYIPRDGMQRIELKETSSKKAAYVTPYPVHPVHLTDSSEYPAYMEYEVPVPDRTTEAEPSIQVPYRSTLKKFQARWVGKLPGAIDGKARLADDAVSGALTNNTGVDLHQVYITYHSATPADDDWVIFLADPEEGSAWPNGASIDLATVKDRARGITGQNMRARTRDQIGDRGTLNHAFAEAIWKSEYLGIHEGIRYGNLDRAALLMTLYDRLHPVRGKAEESVFSGDRYELHRRAGRHLDASAAISTGNLLILARSGSASALPFPLHVGGDLVEGEGVTYYQFVIPMERSGAATQPADLRIPEESKPEDVEAIEPAAPGVAAQRGATRGQE